MTVMKQAIYTFFAFASVALTAMATDGDNAAVSTVDNARLRSNLATERYDNPALMKGRYSHTLTDIEAAWKYHDEDAARQYEEGSGSNRAEISVKAFVLKGSNDIWGSAGYSIGQRREVLFNETSDYNLVYPYVTADKDGGDLHEEIYRFGGGFAHSVNEDFIIGAYAGYRALLAYRQVDPRPRNLTSDLDFAVGLRYRRVALALKAGKYKQTNNVKFYSSTYQPTVYQSTGLGTDYYRFRGENTDCYYNGRNFGAQADYLSDVLPSLTVAWDYFNFDKVISTLNKLPMATVNEHAVKAKAYRLIRRECLVWGVEAAYNYLRRDGDENIFGDAQNNIYPQIASLPMYRRTVHNAYATVSLEAERGRAIWQARISAGYNNDRTRYTEPERILKGTTPYASLGGTAFFRRSDWLWRFDVEMAKRFSSDASLTLPESREESEIEPSVIRMMETLAADTQSLRLAVRADRVIHKGWTVYCRAGWTLTNYASASNDNRLGLAVGLAF